MDISELEAQLKEEPNVTKVVPNVYLELATKSMMHLQSLISADSSNSVPINQLQCQYILDKLCETLNYAKECICGRSLQDVPRSDFIFQNLAQTAMEVDKLVGDCCDAQWIQAAMIVANAKEHFASLAFKLRLYRQLLQSIFEKKATEMLTKLQNPKWSNDIKDAEFSIMAWRVQEDRKQLLSRLKQVGSSESENLRKRLDIFSIRVALLQHNASFVLDPWKVEWKSIKRFPRSQIGKGSSGVVHKVEWLGKYFAEKSFPLAEIENFRKEVCFLAGLSHPNILPLFCYATSSRSCSLVMELMDEDLDSLMRNRLGPKTSLDPPFELLEAIDIMLQVAEGMKYLHQNKVMHRDLKAGNILVKCNDGHVYAKVADFGVSKTIDSRCTDSNQTTGVGTPKWMAPELFSKESHDASPSVSRESDLSLKYPFQVDIYSFGMVCYEILTGCVPFFNFNMEGLRKRIKDGLRPEIPERCPEQLSTLIKKCYDPNPAERPSFRKICVELRHLMWSPMLNNLELGDSTAKWSNLPGAEHLVVKQFQELFSQHKYKEAADFAADSPQGILRTPETVAKFQSIPVQLGQTSPVVQYFGTLLRKGKLNVFESLELSRLIVNQKEKNLLEKYLAEDKLECSDELGDLVQTLDNDMALKIYNKMRENAKMGAAVAENGQFDRDLIYSKQGQGSLPHSPLGRGSPLISPLVVDLDRSHQQVPEDVDRKFHEFNLQGIGIEGKKLVEERVNELKSFSESLKEPKIPKVVPSAYLELATKSVMHIQILISPLNQLQCLYLLDKLCETLNDAKACIHGLSPQDIERTHHILENLARMAKEVEILVGDCFDAQWIRSAMILANAKEHFASLAFKLRLNMQLLQSIFKEGATEKFLTKLQDPKWSDDVKDEEFLIIDEKAKEDQQRLLSRLIEVGSSDSENLIKRLEISSHRATFLQESATNVINAWKVEYKSIHRVPNSVIGRGSTADVHKVTWLGKDFAEKCFHGPENQWILQEASLLAGLSHPNILPLFCYATGDHGCSVVMELMDEDLYSLMKRRLGNEETLDGPFKLLEAVDIMLQVAEGMNYLHQNRVVHRDLKSMNILVKYNEHDRHVYAKVADFGLSRTKESRATVSMFAINGVPTPWMAPELFGDSEDDDVGPSSSSESNLSLKYHFKGDVYSFGMVCYEILTGRVPFLNVKLMDLGKMIKDGLRPNMPEQCPEQLSTLVRYCDHPNPKARPTFPDICVELRHIMCSLMVDSMM